MQLPLVDSAGGSGKSSGKSSARGSRSGARSVPLLSRNRDILDSLFQSSDGGADSDGTPPEGLSRGGARSKGASMPTVHQAKMLKDSPDIGLDADPAADLKLVTRKSDSPADSGQRRVEPAGRLGTTMSEEGRRRRRGSRTSVFSVASRNTNSTSGVRDHEKLWCGGWDRRAAVRQVARWELDSVAARVKRVVARELWGLRAAEHTLAEKTEASKLACHPSLYLGAAGAVPPPRSAASTLLSVDAQIPTKDGAVSKAVAASPGPGEVVEGEAKRPSMVMIEEYALEWGGESEDGGEAGQTGVPTVRTLKEGSKRRKST